MTDALRILHVISTLTPGGAEKVVLELAGIQARNGHDVSIFSPNDVGDRQVISTPDHVEMIYANPEMSGRLRKYWDLFAFLLKHRRDIRNYDILHLHLTYGALFGVMFKTFNFGGGPKIVETNHSAGMPMGRFIRSMRARISALYDSHVLVVEDTYWRGQASNRGFQVELVENGTDVSVFNHLLNASTQADDQIIVGTVGMLRADRTPHIFIEIFNKIKKLHAGKPIKFLIVGDGAMRADLEKKAQESGLTDDLEFFGVSAFPAEQAASMDVFISLNVGALTGMAAIEAAFTGTALVGYQMDPNYVMQDQDWIWSSHDTEAVAKKVLDLLADQKALELVSAHQKRHVFSKHSLQSVYEKYHNIYISILETGNSHEPG